jgi:hypothetical protein
MKDVERVDGPGSQGWTALDALFLRMNNLGSFFDKINKAIVINYEAHDEIGDLDNGGQDSDPENNLEPRVETLLDKEVGKRWTINPKYVNPRTPVALPLKLFNSFSEKLANLQNSLLTLLQRKDELENHLRATYSKSQSNVLAVPSDSECFADVPSLTLRSSNANGMYLHIARAVHKKKLDSNPIFYSIGETQSTKSYVYRVIQPFLSTVPKIEAFYFRNGPNLEHKLLKLPLP